jgi:hypothetical protein
MTLNERIPEMSDADLTALHSNALRLSASGGSRSRQAADLLPALEAEIGARRARAPEPQKRPRAAGTARAKRATNK